MRVLAYNPDVVLAPVSCGVELARLDRVILDTAPVEAERVMVTSCYRPGDPRLHGIGLAKDYDAIWRQGVTKAQQEKLLNAWAALAQTRMGADYDVLAHAVPGRGGHHIHGEWDPKVDRERISLGFFERVRRTVT